MSFLGMFKTIARTELKEISPSVDDKTLTYLTQAIQYAYNLKRTEIDESKEHLKKENAELKARVEALTRTVIEAKTAYEEFSLFVWKAFVTEISNSARVCNRRERYEHLDEKFQAIISDDYVEQLRQAAKEGV